MTRTSNLALPRWPAWPWATALVGSGLAFLALSMWLTGHSFGHMDIDVTPNDWFLRFADASPVAVDAARLLSMLGSAGAVVALTVLLALVLSRAGQGWLAIWLALTVTAGWLVTQLAKHWSGRTRPDTNGDFWTAHGASYPSGHASVGVYAFGAFAVIAVLLLTGAARWWVAVVVTVIGLCIGVSRLVLGVHWLTDVIGGWLLGGAVLSAAVLLLRAYARKTSPTPNAT